MSVEKSVEEKEYMMVAVFEKAMEAYLFYIP